MYSDIIRNASRLGGPASGFAIVPAVRHNGAGGDEGFPLAMRLRLDTVLARGLCILGCLVPHIRAEGLVEPASTKLDAARATVAGENVVLAVDLADARWSVAWRNDLDVGITGVGFSVVVDGKEVAAHRPRTEVGPAQGPWGPCREVRSVWETNGMRVERTLRVDEQRQAVIVGGRIANQTHRDVRLGTARLLEVTTHGGWRVGAAGEPPAAVYVQGHSLLRSTPFEPLGASDKVTTRRYGSSGVLALVSREPAAALVVGYVRADAAAPDLAADFRHGEGGTALSASARFLDHVLGAGKTVELNQVYVAAGRDPWAALEAYGDALAAFSARPVRTGATSLWCSWYAHRMGMTEEKVLANAAVVARHFRPLGLEIMQLDHGWQKGDITGDWVPNDRFPHGLPWLADELRARYGLRLGVWIAPTDVAGVGPVDPRRRVALDAGG